MSNIKTGVVPSNLITITSTITFKVVVDVPVGITSVVQYNVAAPSPPAPVMLVPSRTSPTSATIAWNYVGPPTLAGTNDFIVTASIRSGPSASWAAVSGSPFTVTVSAAQSAAPTGSSYGLVVNGIPSADDAIFTVETVIPGSPASVSHPVTSPILASLTGPSLRQNTGPVLIAGSTNASLEQSVNLSSPPLPGSLIVIAWTTKRTSPATAPPPPPMYGGGFAEGPRVPFVRTTVGSVSPYPAVPTQYGVPTFNGPWASGSGQNFIANNTNPFNHLECGIFVATVAAASALIPGQDTTLINSAVISSPTVDLPDMGVYQVFEITSPTPTVKQALANVESASTTMSSAGLSVAPGQVYVDVLAVDGAYAVTTFGQFADTRTITHVVIPAQNPANAFASLLYREDAVAGYGTVITNIGVYVRDAGSSGSVTASTTATYPASTYTGLTQAIVI